MGKRLFAFVMFFLITVTAQVGCQSWDEPVIEASVPSTAVPPSPTITITSGSTTAVLLPTLIPTPTLLPTASPDPSPTPHPMQPTTIDSLRARAYPGGNIHIRAILEENDRFTRSYIDYPSDGLTITGIMQIPPGDGPFPVIILNHGYFDRDQYTAGTDTWQAAAYLNDRGYLTIAPDFRSWGESDIGFSFFHTGLVIDTLNLISALPSIPQADPAQVGVWGHSMGGGITTKMLAIDTRIKAAVLYAPNSANDADLIARWGSGCLTGQSEAAGDQCNPAEVIPPELSPVVVQAYLDAVADPAWLRQIAPIYHLDQVTAPVQIHSGLADGTAVPETPPKWATAVYDALLAAGKDAALYTYPGQGHFFTGDAWNLFMQRTADFFDMHLKQVAN